MTNLPEVLYVPALGDPEHFEAVKATGPDGKSLPVAFTTAEYLDHFARATGMDARGVRAVRLATGQLLDDLVASQEPEICIDPMQPSETLLSYNKTGAVRRAQLPHGSIIEVREPGAAMPGEYVKLLCEVAESLPTVEEVWLMEMRVKPERPAAGAEDEVRPLLVVRQSVPEEHEAFHDTFMEFGDRWCENLPRGIAVDMLPEFAQPVAGSLRESCRVYSRS
ncbi:MAG: hypothetical protein IT462_00625 [Planctomycetes bacterium]|nr:hypothetical protein [Planctomycetota bacterium]